MSTTIRSVLFASLATVAVSLPLLAEPVEVAGLTFAPPESFKVIKPTSAMRKAQFSVGEGEKAGEIVFFYFGAGGAGGVDENVRRWFGQFKEPKEELNAKIEKTAAGEIPVTLVSATGTFKSGPPSGPFVEKAGHALLGAIVEGKDGAVFIKFTGPKETVDANAEAFKKLVTGAK